MGDEEVKRQCFDSKSGQDFISNLPQSLKDNILMRLNIIEAVRTCVLSKRWRYAWCTMPNLAICTADFGVVDKDRKLDCSKFIGSLLSHHKGPIMNFSLSVERYHPDDFDRWIHALGDKGVKDLCFNFDMRESCDIPSSFFSRLLALTDLKFTCHTLDVPQVFRSFQLLRNLELTIATMACTDLERLVSRCPLLQNLQIENAFEIFGNLVIRSQSLETIVLFASCEHLVLDTPKLSTLHIAPIVSIFYSEQFKRVRVAYQSYPDEPLHGKKSCKSIVVNLLKTMAKLPIKFNHLTETVIMIGPKKDDLVSALYLIRSCPKLQRLHVKLYDGESDWGASSSGDFNSWLKSEAKSVLFNDLKGVIIEPCGLQTTDSSIALIKFILSTAHVLQCMIIRDVWVSFMADALEIPSMLERVSQSDESTMRMGKAMAFMLEVLKLPRLSNRASIAFQDSELYDRLKEN